MPVLAFCEKGLIIDVFGEKPVILKCHMFQHKKDTLITYFGNILKFINFTDLTVQKEISLPDISAIKLSDDGTKLCVLLHNNDIKIFNNFEEINTVSDIENYDISDHYYCISTKTDTKIFKFDKNEPIFHFKHPIKSVFTIGSLIILVTLKTTESQKVIFIKNEKIYNILELTNVYRTIIKKHSTDESKYLLLIDTEYTKNSYYAESTLFYLSFSNMDEIKELCDNRLVSNKDEKSSSDTPIPEIITKNNDFIVFQFKNMPKIHNVEFLKNSFFVCFGDQPAKLFEFNLNGKLIKRYPKTIGNTIVFNHKEDKYINAGLGNLPGSIKVYYKNELACSFEMLGASIISWLNNDSYFMIAITNYFKSQNKILIYDYYGSLLEEMECRSLITAEVYGELTETILLEPPKTIIKPEVVSSYVPPNLMNKIELSANKIKNKVVSKKKVPKKSKEEIQKELDKSIELKERLKNGEELTLEEENMVFNIKNLQEELEKPENN